jgi:AcrR family transcriptional regulator
MPRAQPDRTPHPTSTRTPLTRDRILRTAVALADRDGVGALGMRGIARELGVDPMSLYNHVRDKDDLLDGALDVVIGGIEPVIDPAGWRPSLRATVLIARETLKRHPWAKGVIVTRTTATPAYLGYLDAILGVLRDGGFPIDLVHHTIHVMSSRLLGFSQDLFDDPDHPPDPAVAAIGARQLAMTWPHVGELAIAVSHDGGLGGCDGDVEFVIALDLILDGLERLAAPSDAPSQPTRRSARRGSGVRGSPVR